MAKNSFRSCSKLNTLDFLKLGCDLDVVFSKNPNRQYAIRGLIKMKTAINNI
jgi:hypothetical protein